MQISIVMLLFSYQISGRGKSFQGGKLPQGRRPPTPSVEESQAFTNIYFSILLSLILFVLAVNPLSYLSSKEDGIKLTIEDQIRIISHLFFVDDLKLFASSLARIIRLYKKNISSVD